MTIRISATCALGSNTQYEMVARAVFVGYIPPLTYILPPSPPAAKAPLDFVAMLGTSWMMVFLFSFHFVLGRS